MLVGARGDTKDDVSGPWLCAGAGPGCAWPAHQTTRSVRRVPARPVVPETALAAIRRFCQANSPAEHAHELRVEYSIRGKSVTLYECRPPWPPDLEPEWIRQEFAQLRYNPDDRHWRLYYADRNSRWHPYDMTEPTTDLGELIAEIDDDPTCIFWG
jgi:hypothetical protein